MDAPFSIDAQNHPHHKLLLLLLPSPSKTAMLLAAMVEDQTALQLNLSTS